MQTLILTSTLHTTSCLGMLYRLVALDSTVLRTVHTVEIEYERAGAVLAAPKKNNCKKCLPKKLFYAPGDCCCCELVAGPLLECCMRMMLAIQIP